MYQNSTNEEIDLSNYVIMDFKSLHLYWKILISDRRSLIRNAYDKCPFCGGKIEITDQYYICKKCLKAYRK